MYSGVRMPAGLPSTKQKSQWLAQRRIRGGSSVTPIASPSGRSTSYSTASPSGWVTDRRNRSSAVRNSQSRKSSSARPLTAWSSIPGTSEKLHREPERLGGGGLQVRGQEGDRCPGRIGNETRHGHLHGHQRVGLSDVLERRVALPLQVPRGGQEFERAPVERVELHELLC